MLLHEGLEQAAGLLRIFSDIPLQWGYRYGAHIDHLVGGGDRDAQSESFNVTVKLPRQKERCSFGTRMVLKLMATSPL